MKAALRPFLKPLQNERGQAVMNFIFASVLILAAASLLISISVALSFVEVVQYVSFSGARSYFAADINQEYQKKNAVNKMESLIASLPVLRDKNNTWIELKPFADAPANYRTFYGEAADLRPNHNGVELAFKLKVLNFRIPFVNTALSYGKEEADAPTAQVSSLLGREPTFEECRREMNVILDSVVHANGAYGRMRHKGIQEGQFHAILDNGC